MYVHRLRSKLEDYYNRVGRGSPHRLTIPKGEYRVLLIEQPVPLPDQAQDQVSPLVPMAPTPLARAVQWRRWALWAGWPLAGIAALGWVMNRPSATPAQAAASRAQADPFWHGLGQSGRPILLVIGDYYIFGESSDGMSIDRLVRDFRINSATDLMRLGNQPDGTGLITRDLGLHYLPVGAADAIRAVAPVLDAGANADVRIVSMSSLTADQMKSSDIIYVGYLSGLGMLRDAVFSASSLHIGQSYDELVDRSTGKRYTADWLPTNSAEGRGRDFAYIASLKGPSGNRIIVIAGTRDIALRQSSEMITDRASLATLQRPLNGATDFESLFQVDGVGDINMAARNLFTRPIRRAASWQTRPADFPDAPPTAQ